MTVPIEIVEEVAADAVSNATRMLLITDWSPRTEREGRQLLAELREQQPVRGPLFGAAVEEYASALELWAAQHG